MQEHSSSRTSRPRRGPKQSPKLLRVKTSCTTCRDKKLRCDRAKPCESCSKRRVTDDCRYDDGHNDIARAHAEVRKGLQRKIDALEQENAEYRNKVAEQSNKIAELLEANNRAADVICKIKELVTTAGDLPTSSSNLTPFDNSHLLLPLRTRDHPALKETRGPSHWQNQAQPSAISRYILENEIDRLRCLQQLVLQSARSVVVRASPALANLDPTFDYGLWQQVCYAAVVLGISMCERGDFGTDHDLVEGVFQSFERLRCRHPTNLQIKTAAEKIHGFLDPEHLNEAFARHFPFPQTIPTDPCTALVAASACIPFDIPGSDERQQIESSVIAGNLSSQQNGVVPSKQKIRRRPPLILGSYAMVPDVAVLPTLAIGAVPGTPGHLDQLVPTLRTFSRPPPELHHPPLSLPSLTSSALTLPHEIHEQTTNIIDPWKHNHPSVDNLRAVLHKSPALVDSLAPTTGMNQESMDVTAMSGMEFSAYHPPLNLCYFTQEANNADGGLSSSSAHGILSDTQPLYFEPGALQFPLPIPQSPVVNATHGGSFSSDSTDVGMGTWSPVRAL